MTDYAWIDWQQETTRKAQTTLYSKLKGGKISYEEYCEEVEKLLELERQMNNDDMEPFM